MKKCFSQRVAVLRRFAPLLGACMLMATTLFGQTPAIEGDWLGTLNIQSTSLRMVFHISRTSDGASIASLDSPDQGAYGLAIDSVIVEGRNIRLPSSLLRGEFSGTIQPDYTTIEGTWSQSGTTVPIQLSRIYEEISQ